MGAAGPGRADREGRQGRTGTSLSLLHAAARGGAGPPVSALRAGRGGAGPHRRAINSRVRAGGGRAAGTMQGNGQQAGKGHEEHLAGVGAADGGLPAAAVPMLPAMELAEEPEKPPGGRSKDPNTYKVLSLVRAGAAPGGRSGASSPRQRGARLG